MCSTFFFVFEVEEHQYHTLCFGKDLTKWPSHCGNRSNHVLFGGGHAWSFSQL